MKLALLAALLCASPIRFAPNELQWKPGAATMPKGTQVAVLEGNPKEAGLFTMRVKLPAGFQLPPHSHPQDERVTVLSGTVHVGYAEAFDKAKSVALPAGSFYVTPAGQAHFLWSDEEVVLQLNNQGPWLVSPVTQAMPARKP